MSTSAERMQLYRARQRGEAPPPSRCCDCNKRITGARGEWCSRCWLKTDAGREWQRLRIKAYRDGLRL